MMRLDIPQDRNYSAQRKWCRANAKLLQEWPGLVTLGRLFPKRNVRRYKQYVAGRTDGMNRAQMESFIDYWLCISPLHFEDIFKLPATEENITATFRKQRRDEMICASAVADNCDCYYCKKKRFLTADTVEDTPVPEEEEEDDEI